MKNNQMKKYILLILILIIGSLGAGLFMSINKKIPIEDLEIVVDNAEDGNFYSMLVDDKYTRVFKVNSEGQIIDRNIMKVSNLKNVLDGSMVEYEGSVLEEGDGYLYCVKRWFDTETMRISRRDIVRLDVNDLSKKPEILYSYENLESSLPEVTSIIENNGIIYVSLMDPKGEKAYIDEISYLSDEKGYEVKRLMSLDAPKGDRYNNILFNLQGEMIALTKGGRVYLYDQKYDSKLIYPESLDSTKQASFILVTRLTGNVIIYSINNKEVVSYDRELKQLKKEIQDKIKIGSKNNEFKKNAFFNKNYLPIYLKYDEGNNNVIVVTTTRDPMSDECKIIRLVEGKEFKNFDHLEYDNNITINEILLKFWQVFYISGSIVLAILFIVYVVKRGRKVVYKFVLVMIPILVIGFSILCYFQIDYGKKVVYDLKLANAMTVNHSVSNNINSKLVHKLRDNSEAYWDGTYRTLYDSIQVSSKVNFGNDGKIFDKHRIAGIDNNYIYNEIFLVKNKRLYTGVSDVSGFMIPMGTRYFNGTEAVFEELMQTGEAQNGTMVSKTNKGGIYITPIVDGKEVVGILSTFYDKYTISEFVSNNIERAIIICTGILLAALIPIMIVFSIVLKPLKELEKAVNQVAAGNYSIKLVDTGNDEFSKIRTIFNKMCDKLNGIIYRINNINDSYFRFVPRHMFSILDKKDILDIKLGDKRNVNCVFITHTLYNFEEIERDISDNGGDRLSNIIGFVDRYFNTLYSDLRDKQGSLVSSELNLEKMEYIFLNGEKQALDYAIGLIKKLLVEEQLNKLKKLDTALIIYKANILHGIVGEEKRSLPFTASIDKEAMNVLLEDFKGSGAKIIITEDIKRSLENFPEINMRYIGYSLVDNQKKRVSIYEVLDCCEIAERQQKESTITIFQKALDLFYNKEFYLARNEFSNVIRESPKDNVARWYLFLSDKYCNDKEIKDYNLALYGDKSVEILE